MRNQQNKLATLAALAGLSQQLSAGPRQDAEMAQRDQQNRIAQAMTLLGLQQTGQNQQQEQAFRQQELTQRGSQFDQQQQGLAAERDATAQYRTGQLGLEGQHYSDEATHNANQQSEAAATNQKGIQLQVLRELMANHMPGTPMDPAALEYMKSLDPEHLGPILQSQQEANIQQGVRQKLPDIQALYAKNPPNLQQMLTMQEGSTPPQVWAGLPWDQLNSALSSQQPTTHPNIDAIRQGFQQHGLGGAVPGVVAGGLGGAADALDSGFTRWGHVIAGQDFDNARTQATNVVPQLMQYLPQLNAQPNPNTPVNPQLQQQKQQADRAQMQKLLQMLPQ